MGHAGVPALKELAEREGAEFFSAEPAPWEGLISVPPALVMEGYTVLADECRAGFQPKLGDSANYTCSSRPEVRRDSLVPKVGRPISDVYWSRARHP